MKVKILLILLFSTLFLQSCAPTQATKIAAVTSSDQKAGYDGTITSQKKHFVSLSPYSQFDVAKDKTMFMMSIQNCGEGPIDIDYDNISVIFKGDSGDQALKRINVQKSDDFMNDLKEEYSNKEKKFIRAALESIKLDIESAASRSNSSSSDSDSSSSSDFSSSSSSDFSSSSSSGFSSSSSSSGFDNPFSDTDNLSSSDLDDVEYDLDDLKMDIEVMRKNNELLQTAIQEIVMKPQTIMPGDSFSGIMVFDTRDMNAETGGNFQITVSVDREEHRFTFKRGLNNK